MPARKPHVALPDRPLQGGANADPIRQALINFGNHAPSGVMADCIAEHALVLQAMDQFYEGVLHAQVRFEMATSRYASQADDERDKLEEAKHKRTMAQLRRERDELKARREIDGYRGVNPDESEAQMDGRHRRVLAHMRRKKEQLQARREVVSAEHGLEAERTLKDARFALGKRRLESKIAEVEVGVAVARSASGQDARPAESNESSDVAMIHTLIERKRRDIEEGEADGKDTTAERGQLAKLKQLLAAS